MKKYLIISALLFTSFYNSAEAQDENDQREKLSFGVKAGLNYSNVWDGKGQDFNADPKLGLAGGLFVSIPFDKTIGFQPELMISQKGFQANGTLLNEPYSFSRTTTYLDIPLQLQLKPLSTLTLLVGPQYSYLLNERNVYTFNNSSSAQAQEFSNDNPRKNILGFIIGADVHISKLVLSGRACWDFQTNNGDGSSSTPRYKNQWLQCTIGYKF